jgi:hypothetical protein
MRADLPEQLGLRRGCPKIPGIVDLDRTAFRNRADDHDSILDGMLHSAFIVPAAQ